MLRYIAWNDDHNFLDDHILEPNEGVTFDLINQKPQGTAQEIKQEKPEEQKNELNKENQEKKIEEEVKSLLIEDVVNETYRSDITYSFPESTTPLINESRTFLVNELSDG